MTNPSGEGLSEPLEFPPDLSSTRNTGVHRPVVAEVFTEEGEHPSMPTKVHLLVNPFAGKKRGRTVATEVIERLKQAGVEVSATYSAYSGHLVTLAAALVVNEGELIAVVGGDGSLSEVITGRMAIDAEQRDTFAIVPAGTGNSQAHDLGLASLEDAVEAMLRGRRQALDLARVELTEGLPGSTGSRWYGILTTWSRGAWGLTRPFKPRKCAGWVRSDTTSVSCWPFLPRVEERRPCVSTTVSSPMISRCFWFKTAKQAARNFPRPGRFDGRRPDGHRDPEKNDPKGRVQGLWDAEKRGQTRVPPEGRLSPIYDTVH